MNRKAEYLFLSMFVVGIVYLSLKSVSISRKNRTLHEALEEYVSFYNRTVLEREGEGMVFPSEITLQKKDGDFTTANKVFSDKALAFTFSVLNCSPCIDSELSILSSFLLNNNEITGNVCVLVRSEELSDLFSTSRYLKTKGLDIPIYRLPPSVLRMSIDEFGRPYYFITDSTRKMYSFFITTTERPGLTEMYLNNVYKRFMEST